MRFLWHLAYNRCPWTVTWWSGRLQSDLGRSGSSYVRIQLDLKSERRAYDKFSDSRREWHQSLPSPCHQLNHSFRGTHTVPLPRKEPRRTGSQVAKEAVWFTHCANFDSQIAEWCLRCEKSWNCHHLPRNLAPRAYLLRLSQSNSFRILWAILHP